MYIVESARSFTCNIVLQVDGPARAGNVIINPGLDVRPIKVPVAA